MNQDVATEIEGFGKVLAIGGPFGRVLLPKAESEWELPLDVLPEPADWKEIFGRAAPLVVEIGSGGGRTIMTLAEQHPEWNCLGIERCGEYYRIMRERAARRKFANFRCARIDAAYLIQHYFAGASVHQYHIYFPDPWPKKKHLKRRLFNPDFCAGVKRTLEPGGTLFFATDHADYYAEILPLLREYLHVTEHPEPWEDAPQGRTNFEVKYMKAGRGIYRLIATKTRG
ncbi:MAG TPA: tRNA (guanosine(46)-N7)-methyltransferase TrmB [Planctomycetota bacterium]|nr:tRNA (guanosine(46)-N7)-methyltransferase TrmB [Planctomycetota bacterium]